MRRFKPLFFVGLFIFFASAFLSRSSASQVRTVEAVGMFATGMGCGAAVFGFVTALRERKEQ